MELVEHDGRDAVEKRLVVEHAQQHAGRDDQDARPRAGLAVEPDLVAEGLAERRAVLGGHPAGGGPGGDPPRFEHQREPVAGEAALDEGGRDAGGLAGAGRGAEHGGPGGPQGGE